jgi:hypothetical protein
VDQIPEFVPSTHHCTLESLTSVVEDRGQPRRRWQAAMPISSISMALLDR